MAILKQNQGTICFKLTSPTGAMEAAEIDRNGIAEITNPAAGVTPVYGPGEYGQPVVVTTNDTAPGDLPSTTITVFDEGSIDYLLKQQSQNAVFPVQRQWNPRGTSRSNLAIFNTIDHLGRCRVTTAPLAGGPTVPFAGDVASAARTVVGEYVMRIKWGSLTASATGDAENVVDLAVLSELSSVPGYPGPDQIMYAACAAGSGATPNVYVSTNGGGSWTVLGTDPLATDESPKHIAIRFINSTQFRVFILRETTDGSNPPEGVYNDFTLGAESTISAWTSVSIGSTNNEAGEAMRWLFPNRLYAAVAGDIHVSTNYGVSFLATEQYTGTTVINGFATGADKSVYAFGASNLLLRESTARSGFTAVTGPTGSDDSVSMAVVGPEEDQTLILGNGTSVFSCKKPVPTAAGDWTALKDFGAAVTGVAPAQSLQAPHGDPDCFFVTVDDTAGEYWFTRDGGQSWRQVTSLSNTGYNGVVPSTLGPNLAYIFADDGAIHKYQA